MRSRRRSPRRAVNVEKSLSGLSARIAGVRIAPTTTMFAVAPDPRKRSASASVHVSAAAFAAAYAAFVCVGACACPARDEDEPATAREEVRDERLGRVPHGRDEQVVEEPQSSSATPRSACRRASRRRGGRARRRAPRAPRRRRPTPWSPGVEQVDDVESRVAGLLRECFECAHPGRTDTVAVIRASRSTTVGPRLPVAPAIAMSARPAMSCPHG